MAEGATVRQVPSPRREAVDHIAYYRPGNRLVRLLDEMKRAAEKAERAE